MLRIKEQYLDYGFGGSGRQFKRLKNMGQSELLELYNKGYTEWFFIEPSLLNIIDELPDSLTEDKTEESDDIDI